MGGEYTNYRRGAGRDKWEQEHQQLQQQKSSSYAQVEDLSKDLLVIARTASRGVVAP